MKDCVVENSKTIHKCGEPRIHTFDNLVQSHPSIVGKTVPIKAEIYPCQEVGFVKAGHAGQESALRFTNRMRPPQ
ncbi:hypothetical protein A2442_03030 [Candidatus Campbellbacteria bacterium RIFOXYC2_FULL_35_25]|uniref:Uncharacterized protein n=1 Tax=Candidatus Campbellbacteria bacterium RIFOXYC2_FULL_35_25 TaxID=1797582 RepID=A0A1F5EJ88_9BACT|nr:MAG: hypothetical protein A2442_03030 [Candidatus Campbellbacteria bacterium RIFOXYC2_FULL_35_25]